MHKLLISFFLVVAINTAYSQTWEVGAFGGGSGYMGDINPVRPYKVNNPAFGGQIKRNFDGNWSVKLGVMRGKIQADDADSPNSFQQERNLNFFSPITEVSLQTEFNFFKYLPGLLPGYGNHRISPYLFTGVGGVLFNPKTSFNNQEVELRDLQTENTDYKKYGLVIPYGAGIKYNIKGSWTLGGEVGYRTVFNDYLDDVSGRYPGTGNLTNSAATNFSDRSINQIGLAGTQRGDFRKKDTYMFTGITLTYRFVSEKCAFEN